MKETSYQYRVGFIDDDDDKISEYGKILARSGIELLFTKECTSMPEIRDWLVENEIECFMIDYQLMDTGIFDFQGTKLVAYLDSVMPDLVCLIMTNHRDDASNEMMLPEELTWDRDVFEDNDKTKRLVTFLKHSAEVFRTRINFKQAKYNKIYNQGEPPAGEDLVELKRLHKELAIYGLTDDISSELLDPKVEAQIHELINKVDEFLLSTKNV